MHAVIVDVSIADAQEAQEELRERVVPMVSKAPGFVAGFWMEAGAGKGHSVVVFESEAVAKEMAERVPTNVPSSVKIERVEVHEVVAHA